MMRSVKEKAARPMLARARFTAVRRASLSSRELECHCQRSIQFRNLLAGKSSDVISERGLGKANELVAMNRTIVFQSVVDTDRYLR